MTDSTHVLSNGQTIWTETFTGKVIASKEESIAVIRQEADRPQMIGKSLVWTPGQIYSDVVETHKVWLKASDGTERHFDLSAVSLPLREGHDVTLVWVGKQGDQSRHLFAAYNHSTGDQHAVDSFRVIGRSGLKLRLVGKAHWWVGGILLLHWLITQGTEGIVSGLIVSFIGALLGDVAIFLFCLITKLRIGKYGQAVSLYEQVEQAVDARLRVIEASLEEAQVDHDARPAAADLKPQRAGRGSPDLQS